MNELADAGLAGFGLAEAAAAAAAAAVVVAAPAFAAVMQQVSARIRGRAPGRLTAIYADQASAILDPDTRAANARPAITEILAGSVLAASVLAAAQLPGLVHADPMTALTAAVWFFAFALLARTATQLVAFESGDAYAGLGLMRDSIAPLMLEPALFLALTCAVLVRSPIANVTTAPAAHVLAAIAFAIAAGFRTTAPTPADRLSAATGDVAVARGSSRRGRTLLTLSQQVHQLTLWTAWLLAFQPFTWGSGRLWLGLLLASLLAVAAGLGVLDAVWYTRFARQQRRWPPAALTLATVAFVIAVAAGAA